MKALNTCTPRGLKPTLMKAFVPLITVVGDTVDQKPFQGCGRVSSNFVQARDKLASADKPQNLK